MKKKTFVTIFPETSNIQLIKEVGMIPYLMSENYNYNSTIATYDNGDYSYLKTEVKGLKIEFIKKYFSNEFLNVLIFLLKSYKRIDVIHLFHFSISKLFLIFLFKKLKKNGAKSYIKLDANQFLKDNNYKGFKRRIVFFLMKNVDLVSAETKELTSYLNKVNFFGKEVKYVPNGILPIEMFDDRAAKINQLITVGRLDDDNKAVNIQIEGFRLYVVKNPDTDWVMKLIGPYNQKFADYFNELLSNFPYLNEKIYLIGPIYHREILFNYYKESKVFLMSSLSESFGFVYLEALYFNCFVISTPIPSAFEITNYGEHGIFYEFNDSIHLSEVLTKNLVHLSCKKIDSNDYILENYNWNKIVSDINQNLN